MATKKRLLTPKDKRKLAQYGGTLRKERMADYSYTSNVVDASYSAAGKRAKLTAKGMTRSSARQLDAIARLYAGAQRNVVAVRDDMGKNLSLYGGMYAQAARSAYDPAAVQAQTGVNTMATGARIARTNMATAKGLGGLMTQGVKLAQAGAEQATADALAEQTARDAELVAQQRLEMYQHAQDVESQKELMAYQAKLEAETASKGEAGTQAAFASASATLNPEGTYTLDQINNIAAAFGIGLTAQQKAELVKALSDFAEGQGLTSTASAGGTDIIQNPALDKSSGTQDPATGDDLTIRAVVTILIGQTAGKNYEDAVNWTLEQLDQKAVEGGWDGATLGIAKGFAREYIATLNPNDFLAQALSNLQRTGNVLGSDLDNK